MTARLMAAIFLLALALRFVASGFQDLSHDAACFYLPNALVLYREGLGAWEGMTIAVPPLFPTLVALLAHLFSGPDHWALEMAGLTLSIVGGALIIFPAYGIARWFFPDHPRIWLITALVAALQILSARFGGDARADSLYALFFTSAVYFGLHVLREPHWRPGAAFGFLVGLSYLLRPEALGLPLLLAVGVIWKTAQRLRHKETLEIPSWLGPAAAAILCLAPCLAWNMLFVHSKLGLWTLSPKAGILLDYDKGQGDVFGSLNADLTMTQHEERLTTPGNYREFTLVDAIRQNPGGMASNIARNMGDFFKFLPDVHGGAAFLIFIYSLWFTTRRRLAAPGSLSVLFTILLFYALSLSIFYMTRRFWLPFLPLTLPWVASGVVVIASQLGDRIKLIVACYIIATLPQTLHHCGVTKNPWRGSAEQLLGEQLLQDLGPGHIYTTFKGKLTWYAQGRHLQLPTSNSLQDIVVYMKHREARYVMVDYGRRRREHVRELCDALEGSTEFRRVARQQLQKKDLQVFELQTE